MRTNLNELKNFLTNELSRRTEINSSYSQRAFARDIGISVTALNEFLAGKRELSYQNIDKIFEYLNSTIYCHWCDKPQKEVARLIGGPRRQFICEDCVGVCNDILRENRVSDEMLRK